MDQKITISPEESNAKARERMKQRDEQAKQAAAKRMQGQDKDIDKLHAFYDARLDKSGKLAIDIDKFKLVELLRNMGFYRYDQPGGGFEYVRILDNKISLVNSIEEIIDVFEDYVRNLPNRKIVLQHHTADGDIPMEQIIYSKLLLQKMYKNINYYFCSTIPRLRPNEQSKVKAITPLKDTKTSKYLFYDNVVLRITTDGVEEIPYGKLEKRLKALNETNGHYIWENSIINRNYERIDSDDRSVRWGEFGEFVSLICGKGTYDDWFNRQQSLMSFIGYLLHDNFETNLKCVLLTDAKQMNGKPSGGTGKGILGKALGFVLNRTPNDHKYLNINGKTFEPKNERRYSEGDITTQLIHIEDSQPDINFEDLFFDVTEGATFRKMYKDQTKHQVKLMISTNTPFDLSAESTKRRIALFELENYFYTERTPNDVFGHMFFGSEWTTDEWKKFDNFMVDCCTMYMHTGLIEAEMLGYKDNLINNTLPPEMVAWFQDYISDAINGDKNQEYCYNVDTMWKDFHENYPDTYKYRRKLTEDCKMWLVTKGIRSGILRKRPDQLILYPKNGTNITNWFVK